MDIFPFVAEHIPQARALALANYREAREALPLLPTREDVADLAPFAENGLGVAALEEGRLVAFLGCYRPREEAWGSPDRGVFSPLYAHGAVRAERGLLYQRLYERAAAQWAAQGVAYHGICLYAHDREAQDAFFTYGFGKRCMDEIRSLEPVPHRDFPGITFREWPVADFPRLHSLRVALDTHLTRSPCFMVSSPEDVEAWLARVDQGDRRTFVAQDAEGEPLAYLDVTDEGENFITWEEDGLMNLQGAYCLPAYRGTGLMDALLDCVIGTLRAEGATLLGVDHESTNPTALHYWQKHFTPYTASLVRRLDAVPPGPYGAKGDEA